MLFRFLNFGHKHPRFSIIFLLIVTLFMALQLPKLSIESSYDSLKSNKLDQTFHDYAVDMFSIDNKNYIFIHDENLFSQQKVQKLANLEADIAMLPYYRSTRSLLNAQNLKDESGSIETRPILNSDMSSEEEFDAARARALYNPFMMNSLISEDTHSTMIALTLDSDLNSDQKEQVFQNVQPVLERYKGDFEQVFLVGPEVDQHYISSAILSDLAKTGPISIFVILLVLFLVFRYKTIAFIIFATASISVIWTFGFLGLFGIPINVMISTIPTLLIVIGATEDAHMFSSYLENVKNGGSKSEIRKSATKIMLKKISMPIFLTVVTTWFGFALTLSSSIPVIQNFAIAASVGFIANGMITVLLVPILLNTFGPVTYKAKAHRVFDIAAVKLSWLATRKGGVILSFVAFISIVCAIGIPGLKINNNPVKFLRDNHPNVENINTMTDELTGVATLNVVIDAGVPGAFKEPAYLEKLYAAQDTISQLPQVAKTESLADILVYTNQEMHEGDTSYYKIPNNSMLVEQYLLFYDSSELERFITLDYQQAQINVRHSLLDTYKMEALIKELEENLAPFNASDFKITLVDDAITLIDSARLLVEGQLLSISLLLLAIALMISFLFFSPVAGLIALIPNILPLVILFGIMGFLNIPLNILTVMVAIILISIAVDDTIHLYFSYFNACQKYSNNNTAIRHALKEQARPVVTTSIALVLGFSTLGISELWVNAQIGFLLAISVLLAMIFDLLVTPVLLARVRIAGLWYHLPKDIIDNIVTKSALFNNMSRFQIKKTISICKHYQYKKNHPIVIEGETSKNMYLILTGSADVITKNENGDSNLIATLGPGDLFGEVAFLSNVTRTASVIAQESTEVISFGYRDLQTNLRFYPFIRNKMALNIASILAKRLLSTTRKLGEHRA